MCFYTKFCYKKSHIKIKTFTENNQEMLLLRKRSAMAGYKSYSNTT